MDSVWLVVRLAYAEDVQDDNVCSYPEKGLAEQHVKLLSDIVKKRRKLRPQRYASRPYQKWVKDTVALLRGLDPGVSRYEPDPEYAVEEVIFRLHVDEFMEKLP